ncbi:hypothetical protein C2S53_015746 [Perilla frutescens var. hirtella]|uniref:Protein FAR1-RELATED SEQUENCE n=1 Tax=Perilla frutescens var. hirtella TaxID=608512 RepID=A0AAD4JFB0_PERFH|nr:hypothetical protein C2S53_015746 [Perilla frutescens var. hirtella]
MDQDAYVDNNACRRLDFFEANKEKEPANSSEEKLIYERHLNISEEKIPKVGMEFDTDDAAYTFYNEYAKEVGFSIRKQSGHQHNGRLLDRIFCCSCQGHRPTDKREANIKSHRPETRTGCKAAMKINGRGTAKYTVTEFIPEHGGHMLASPNKTFLLRSHRNINTLQASQVDIIESSGIAPKAGYTLMSKQMGGRKNVGFILEDYRNYLRSKRTVQTKTGETGAQWPETCHRLCIWHIYQNAATHLSHVFANFTSFSKDFSSCIYDYDEEDDFLNAWHHMLEKYELENNEWLQRLFKIREKWALVYGRQSFCADMITTQRSESMHSSLKKYVSYKHDLLQFFHHFDRLIDDRRYKEYKADFKISQTTPAMTFPIQILKHAATIYTHSVFKLFQEQLSKAYDCKVDLCSNSEEILQYRVVSFGKKYHHMVVFHCSRVEVSCSCRKFEFAGILCSHALKVLSLNNVVEIPDLYILKRWTKNAKKNFVGAQSTGASLVPFEPANEDEQKKLKAVRCKELGNLHNQLAMRATLSTQAFENVKNGLIRMIEDLDASLENTSFGNPIIGSELDIGVSQKATNQDGQESVEPMVKGWKKKEKKSIKTGKRAISGLEKRPRQKKQNNAIRSENNVQVVNSTVNQQNNIAPYSKMDQQNEMSLTKLLQSQNQFSLRIWLCFSNNKRRLDAAADHEGLEKRIFSCLGFEDEVIHKLALDKRHLQVALRHQLKHEDSCWNIFSDAVKKDGIIEQVPAEMEKRRDEILKKCEGLPLMAKMLGEIAHHVVIAKIQEIQTHHHQD